MCMYTTRHSLISYTFVHITHAYIRSKCNVFRLRSHHSCDSFSIFICKCVFHRISWLHSPAQYHTCMPLVVFILSHNKQKLPGHGDCQNKYKFARILRFSFEMRCCCRSLFGPSPRCFLLLIFFFFFFPVFFSGASTCFMPFSYAQKMFFYIQYLLMHAYGFGYRQKK